MSSTDCANIFEVFINSSIRPSSPFNFILNLNNDFLYLGQRFFDADHAGSTFDGIKRLQDV